MAKQSIQQSAHVSRIRKIGKPRISKKKRGNAPARTARSGNGRRIR